MVPSKEEVCYEEDRISLLPDDILCHILSFSPTKDAMGSSVLSKRWRYVWMSVPIINIDDQCSLSAPWRNRYGSSEIKERFMDFVDRVLRLNGDGVSSLREFCLTCYNSYASSRVSSWIGTVITRDIEKLNLILLPCVKAYLIELPLNMFTFKKLVTLKLKGNIILNVFSSVYLPSLKILHLDEMESLDGDSVKHLLAGSPVLEEFHITTRPAHKLNMLFVQSSSLKSLQISNDSDIPIIVDAINLEEIYLTICMPQQFEVNRSSSFVKVNLELFICDRETIGMDVTGNSIVELLTQISSTKHLVVTVETTEALEYTCLSNLPMFHNLTHLEMQVYSCRWPILNYLLDCSPNLISLLLNNYISVYEEDECRQQYQTPKSSMLYLEKVELGKFSGDRNEMKLVSYFLKNSPVLKKMSITYKPSLSTVEKSKVRDEIFMLQNGSTYCEIEFSDLKFWYPF